MIWNILLVVGFGVLAFIQNMAFTWVSRSRNSGDPNYHRWAALCSNAVWFLTNALLTSQLMRSLATGSYWQIAIVFLVYVISTTEGSVLMMKILLSREQGKRRVGAS